MSVLQGPGGNGNNNTITPSSWRKLADDFVTEKAGKYIHWPAQSALPGQCDCGILTWDTKTCLSCPKKICHECNKCILEHCSVQLEDDFATQANPIPYQRFESINARRVQTACKTRLCGPPDEPMYMFGGIDVYGDKCQCSEVLANHKHTEGRATREADAVCKMGHHCKNCFDALMVSLFEPNILATAFQDEDSGDIEVLREYVCKCGTHADLTRGAQCKMCRKPCKPVNLNDPSSVHFFRINSGEEGMSQTPARQESATASAHPGSMGWSNADTCFYLRDKSIVFARADEIAAGELQEWTGNGPFPSLFLFSPPLRLIEVPIPEPKLPYPGSVIDDIDGELYQMVAGLIELPADD